MPVEDFPSGLIHITANGGTSPYTYLWTFPNGGSSNMEDLNDLFVSGYYSVLVTDAAGCTATMDSIFVAMDVAVDPVQKFKSVNIYPVPVSDFLIIDLEVAIKELIIYSIEGRIAKQINLPGTNKINVQDLEAGWYILRITDGRRWYIARFVK